MKKNIIKSSLIATSLSLTALITSCTSIPSTYPERYDSKTAISDIERSINHCYLSVYKNKDREKPYLKVNDGCYEHDSDRILDTLNKLGYQQDAQVTQKIWENIEPVTGDQPEKFFNTHRVIEDTYSYDVVAEEYNEILIKLLKKLSSNLTANTSEYRNSMLKTISIISKNNDEIENLITKNNAEKKESEKKKKNAEEQRKAELTEEWARNLEQYRQEEKAEEQIRAELAKEWARNAEQYRQIYG